MASSSRNGLNISELHSIWRMLPIDLVEVVLKCIPFESLVRFRAVCKQFSYLITSPKFARECQRQQAWKPVPMIVRSPIPLDSCSIEFLNFETSNWMTYPLPILEAPLYPLELSAVSGGLVCFVTQSSGQFVVCNPLTGSFRLLELPCPVVSNMCTLVSKMRTMIRNFAAFTALVVDLQVGTFTLVIVTTSRSEAERKTLLYDSVNESWRSGAPLPDKDDFISHKVINTLTLNGDIYVLLKKWRSHKLWKYNMCKDNWNEILISDIITYFDDDVHIFEHQGQVVIANLWINHDRIIFFRVIEAVVGQVETIVDDTIINQDLFRNDDSYEGWICAATGVGDVICITVDKHDPEQVLHVNCSSKKLTLLPVCPMVKSAAQKDFELRLLEPSLTVDI